MVKPSKESLFRQVYEVNYASLCLYARRFVADAAVREDIVTEAFASLWDKWDGLDSGAGKAVAYVRVSVRNGCLNFLKRQNFDSAYIASCLECKPLYAASPDSVYSLEELYSMLVLALDELPENYRRVFEDYVFEEKPLKDIASDMNISLKSANRYKAKAIGILRIRLKDYLPGLILALTLAHEDWHIIG